MEGHVWFRLGFVFFVVYSLVYVALTYIEKIPVGGLCCHCCCHCCSHEHPSRTVSQGCGATNERDTTAFFQRRIYAHDIPRRP